MNFLMQDYGTGNIPAVGGDTGLWCAPRDQNDGSCESWINRLPFAVEISDHLLKLAKWASHGASW